ncbi:MAG: MBL fold metallo-hydrolase [Phycisphaerales bacterium]|nr:MBL fold metallo-hydrolase [Phycisphaerales bacterium]MCI0631113.1 MBL fold metallo-hydrolase [Phycisphaerales bacterium]
MTIEHAGAVSRRTFLASTGLAATAAWLGPPENFLVAQEPSGGSAGSGGDEAGGLVPTFRKQAQTAKITVEKLRPGSPGSPASNISILIGSGGNIAVLHGKDGKLLVDAGLAGSRPQITEALAGISAEPVKHLVNTHWHFDHTDGNEWLHESGATIIAHENVRKRLSESTRVDPWDSTFPPSPAGALPAFTLRAAGAKDGAMGMTLHLNGTAIRIDAYQPAHTDGDATVEFTDANVIHLGDLFWNGHYPFIDYDTGGSINGMIRAAESNLARVGAKTIIIPGHGPVGGKAQLSEFRDVLVAIRDNVAALKKQGKSIDEVVAEKPTATFDAKWGTFVINGELFTRLVYAGV